MSYRSGTECLVEARPARLRLLGLILLVLSSMPRGALAQDGCRSVQVENRIVRACVAGTGSPTVVLAAGAGQTSRTWRGLVPELSALTRVVTFDRAGLGGSDPGPEPRTPSRIAEEMRALLPALGVDGPLVLVGHSMGGVHALRFAERFPDGVRAVVLLDTPPPGFEEDRRALLTDSERAERDRVLEEGAGRAPVTVRLEREGAADPAEWAFTDLRLGVSLHVVVADAQDFGDLGSPEAHRALWLERSQAWLSLSPDADLHVAEGSGHMVHHDRPRFVLDLVEGIVRSVRGS